MKFCCNVGLYVVVRRCFVALSQLLSSILILQAMTKGAKMLEKERERKKEGRLSSLFAHCFLSFFSIFFYNVSPTISAADANTKAGGDISISDGSSEISGVPKDREKPHDISNH